MFATVSYCDPRTPPRHAVRTATRKLIRNVTDGSIELYDLVADPGEQRNLGLAGPGGHELLDALDAVRLRLADRGDHVLVRSHADHAIRYKVTLTPDPPAAFADADRLTLERNDLLAVGAFGASLTLSGTLEPGDEDHARADLSTTTGKLDATITVDGAPAPDGAFRVGSSARPAASPVDLADPALRGAPPARTGDVASADGTPITVTFWRVPRSASPTPAPGR